MAVMVSIILYLNWAYGAMMRGNSLNVDDYTKAQPGFKDRVFVAFTHWYVVQPGLSFDCSWRQRSRLHRLYYRLYFLLLAVCC